MSAATAARRSAVARKPKWDAQNRQLSWRGAVIKTYWHDAANQRAVLQAFQDDSWPARVDDPLAKNGSNHGKARLRETVKSLNRNLAGTGIRFRMDGGGAGIRWEERKKQR